MVPDAPNPANAADSNREFAEANQKSEKKPVAQQLADLALEVYDLGIDEDGKPFGVRKGGHVARPLLGGRRSVRKELGGLYYRMTGKPATQNALTEALSALEAEAEDAGEPHQLFLRAARTGTGDIYVDMGDSAERVIRITPEGWEVLDADGDVPVIFRRTNLTAALPTPEPGGDLEQLWQFVNMKSGDDRQVLRGFLVAAHILVGLPCPILALLGEQGTAKTSSARRVFSLFDPTTAPTRRPPNDADSYLHAVHSSRGTMFDNLSSILPFMSDAMCRTVTGDSDVGRTFYTNGEAYVIKVQGALGWTGIDVGSLNSDLAERSVWGNLEVIPAAERKSERELNAAWDEAYPSMLGGLLDLVVLTLQRLPEVDLAEKPRMADFAEVLAALDLATGSDSLEYYTLSQETVATSIVETDDFLVALAKKVTGRWEGTGSELHKLLPIPAGADSKYWPRPRGVDGALKRRAPDLRKAGWSVKAIAPDPKSKRAKTWVLVPPGAERVTDADIADIQLDRETYQMDVDQWTDRALEHGATRTCAEQHAKWFRMDSALSCNEVGCASQWRPEYRPLVDRSTAIERRLFDRLERLDLTLVEFDQLVADREAA